MKSVTNRAFMAKKKMYKQPQTETTPIQVVNTLCSSQTVGFGEGEGSGEGLAPKRQAGDPQLF